MFGHASPVGRELSALPRTVAPFCSGGVALLHGRGSPEIGTIGGVQIQLPRGWRGLVMTGGGERRRRNQTGQGDGGKKFLHVTSPVDDHYPEAGVKADRSIAGPLVQRCGC